METKSQFASKINWAQAVGIGATVLAMLGIDMDPETQIKLVAGIQGVVAVVTWVMRTWFTTQLIK
jgi:hypothetical protein